jgi:hypothetical protein
MSHLPNFGWFTLVNEGWGIWNGGAKALGPKIEEPEHTISPKSEQALLGMKIHQSGGGVCRYSAGTGQHVQSKMIGCR